MDRTQIVPVRIILALVGLIAGFAFYGLVEWEAHSRAWLCLVVISFTGFGSVLLMSGPISPAQTLWFAVPAAAVSCMLALWASFRFVAVDDFLEQGRSLVALVLAIAIALPFGVAGLMDRAKWRSYEVLFEESRAIVLRAALGALFAGLFWVLLFLSDALLQLVNVNWIEDLIDVDAVPFALTGLTFGFGLALAQEYAGGIAGLLAARPARLFLPLVAAISAIFLLALPFQGFDGVFAEFSAAGTLMLVAAVGIWLITLCVDRDGAHAAVSPAIVASARLMAIFLPVLSGLALWSVSIRIGQYGLSPDRIAALTLSCLALIYGLVYCWLAVPAQLGWRAKLRSANSWLALIIIFVGLIWSTPLLNPERLSAQSQIARFSTGLTTVEELDFWTLGKRWGGAGQDALQELSLMVDHPDYQKISELLEILEKSDSAYAFRNAVDNVEHVEIALQTLADLREQASVYPADEKIPDWVFDKDLPDDLIAEFGASCARTTPAGNRGCLIVIADFDPRHVGEEVFLFSLQSFPFTQTAAIGLDENDDVERLDLARTRAFEAEDAIDRILAGEAIIAPMTIQTLGLDGEHLGVLP